jgi:hypothetical protein
MSTWRRGWVAVVTLTVGATGVVCIHRLNFPLFDSHFVTVISLYIELVDLIVALTFILRFSNENTCPLLLAFGYIYFIYKYC